MIMAVIKNNTKVVSLLVKAGASLDIQDKVEVFSTILKITTYHKKGICGDIIIQSVHMTALC